MMMQGRKPAGGGGGSFDPNVLSWVASYWTEGADFAALGLSDGATASSWPDESGTRDLSHAATSPLPLYRAASAAMNSKPAIDHNGADNRYTMATTITQTQPLSYVLIMSPIDLLTQRIHMQSSGSNRPTLRAPHGTNSGDVSMTAGTTLTSAGGVLTANVPHLIVAVFDGASSVLEVNGVSVATGSTSSSLDGRTVSVAAVGADTRYAFAGIYAGNVLADGNWSTFETDAMSHYGI